ncbi:hydroxyacylglutathione hydrolase [Xanthomonas citri]|uniref:hydroxyacylglutathione hydrolase n=1 Tax=Xanthomonas citri TaxID=346 RepID=UPI000247D1C7|nr:hydroxyacylglutathione hydrolase [Xanthomonas citri]MBE0314090.1 hydroxyacylglutathione hydrolase [Xanthomonas citri pv. punicae]MDS0761998.1 hydroxyacylglutathione hydrolase [Xanthomonas citri pv. punicae]MDS0765780.1 hydroxyacylglutathione hydrolase [Xanthomonas citri pv. punicae]MDS0800544.1 hydroxyacylglutathione hydrolase [Xanthomonas citri pv. punicae]MDS0833187.1 hydroxyacylglutathione hydrolase [Xanthomonas citri pv. punicae]
MRLIALPAFDDNYIWALVAADGRAIIVDPGQAEPVLAAAQRQGLVPSAVLLTHHHGDHIGGVAELQQRWPDLALFGPADERIPTNAHHVGRGERLRLLDVKFQVIEVPGHTRSHIAFLADGHLFSGDTLFSLGCGRMFEGTAPQMFDSLQRLASLPGETLVCCGHEYTLANAAFALHVDPTNAALQRRQQEAQAMRHAARPTLPISLKSELATNPFLRTSRPEIRAAVAPRAAGALSSEVDIFAELRRWKDEFRA